MPTLGYSLQTIAEVEKELFGSAIRPQPGKVLHQTITVEEILKMMEEQSKNNGSMGVSLIFHPQRQLAQQRASNQKAIYIAQMDLRVDLSEVWANLQDGKERVFIKLVLAAGTTLECHQYLQQKNITQEFLFPDLPKNTDQ